MSATNRSDVRDPEDHYGTPVAVALAAIEYLYPRDATRARRTMVPLSEALILESSAGRGPIIRALLASGAPPRRTRGRGARDDVRALR